jgi:arylsulfatase A-like enzyme
VPPENGMLSEILGERGWNTYMVGKWHLCPTDESLGTSLERCPEKQPRAQVVS